MEELASPALQTVRMATVSEVTTLPADIGQVIAEADGIGQYKKSGEKSGTDEENTKSEGEGSVVEADGVEDRGKPSQIFPEKRSEASLRYAFLYRLLPSALFSCLGTSPTPD